MVSGTGITDALTVGGIILQVKTAMINVTPDMLGKKEYKRWKRISEDVLTQAKGLLDAGECISLAAKAVGMIPSSLSKVAKRNGWQVKSARPNRRIKDDIREN